MALKFSLFITFPIKYPFCFGFLTVWRQKYKCRGSQIFYHFEFGLERFFNNNTSCFLIVLATVAGIEIIISVSATKKVGILKPSLIWGLSCHRFCAASNVW